MLRPIDRDSLDGLLRAAARDDVVLDLALLRVGVLAPVDLDEIRAELARPGVVLHSTTNRDGHCIVQFVHHDRIVATMHHDGTVHHPLAATA